MISNYLEKVRKQLDALFQERSILEANLASDSATFELCATNCKDIYKRQKQIDSIADQIYACQFIQEFHPLIESQARSGYDWAKREINSALRYHSEPIREYKTYLESLGFKTDFKSCENRYELYVIWEEAK